MKYNPIFDYSKSDLLIEENLVYWKFSELLKNLIIISSEPDRQIEYIGYGVVTDEMALDFDTYYSLSFQSYLDFKLISNNQKSKLDDLAAFFNSRDPKFWDDSKLNTNPEWKLARQKAKDILKSLDKENLTLEYVRFEEKDNSGNLIKQTTRTRKLNKNNS